MKNKGVMISLAAIVVIGMMITTGTHSFIEKNSSKAGETAQVTAAAMDGAGAEFLSKEASAFPGAGQDAGTDSDGKETAGRNLEERQREGIPEPLAENEEAAAQRGAGEEDAQGLAEQEALAEFSLVDDDSLTAGLQQQIGDGAVEDGTIRESLSYYVKRLQDLDSQIQKNRENQTGANVNSSVKSAASNELKLWDSELNDIYNAILEQLEKEESERLVKEEREWLKERDFLAMEAARNSTGGSSESIEYTLSLIESTRARAYELAEKYGQVLGE